MDYTDRKRDEDRQRSEAVLHFTGEEDLSAEKLPDNYHPHWSERDVQRRPRQMFSMNNSYGDVSVAANRKQEMTLTVSEKRRHNSETLDHDHQKLNGERRKSVVGPLGWTFTNSSNPIDSAFAFKTKKLQPAERVLAQIKKNVESNSQNTLEYTIPFLSLDRDKKKLQGLINEIGGARKEEQDLFGLEGEKERLTRGITQKEQEQGRFLQRLHLAINKAKVITGAGSAEWLKPTTFTGSVSVADANPEDEEDDIEEGQEESVQKGQKVDQKKTKAEKNK